MKILAIETSCDETSAAVVEKGHESNVVEVLSLVTSSSLLEHAKTGGIIPERAARMQLEYMLPVVSEALKKYLDCDSRLTLEKHIDTIAVTSGPGLIGSLLVGVECAKTLSYVFKKPLIPVNHLLAHLYANFISENKNYMVPDFPFIGLIISGGHTDLLLFKDHDKYTWLGGTRDDAIGEALDKIGRKLGLAYPAGPEIEKRALKVSKTSLRFQSPLIDADNFDFSFSGLKTEVARYIDMRDLSKEDVKEICFATQKAAFDVIIKKTLKAASQYMARSIVVGGGVAANLRLKVELEKMSNIPTFFPEKKYTVDNAAMIGAWALFHPEPSKLSEVLASPEMYFA